MKATAIIQARMSSTRLPGKVLMEVMGRPLLSYQIERLRFSKRIDEIIIATTTNKEDDPIVELAHKEGLKVFRGLEDDVLDRYYQAAKKYKADVVVRITGDCPLIDYEVTDQVINRFLNGDYDIVCNTKPPTYPDGLDTEVFSFTALEKAWNEARKAYEREHVTPYIHESGLFQVSNVTNDIDLSDERWTVDEPEDYELITTIIKDLGANGEYFGVNEILAYKKQNPDLFKINQYLKRDEGATMNTGVKLWRRSKKIIPGGNMLLSKRAEMFLPGKWPAYYSKAKGCTVWDLDNNQYTDMSIMGIGTNALGYANDEVDQAVRKVIDKSNTSTFNCPEEVYLAEKLVELHPWADMVRFARTGGEANAIAIRIARAASGKDKVAFCGYHGWYDWYLAANLSDVTNLKGHLLSGLEPNGVPKKLEGTSVPFNYNDFGSLQRMVGEADIGVIMMEVSRNFEPQDNFLQNIRELATKEGIVLIFDEITSGFRVKLGGSHLKYGIDPDMAVFGKAMGNGYAISAVIGKREVMEYAQSSFISSTFWTERIGPAAALKTIEIMERDCVPERLTDTGHYISQCWNELAIRHDLDIYIYGIPAITHISFNSDHELALKTIITQEMLKAGYLATNSIYVCTEHTHDVVDAYIDAMDKPFGIIGKISKGSDAEHFLEGPICHGGFKRVN